jgi:hypothetical protein
MRKTNKILTAAVAAATLAAGVSVATESSAATWRGDYRHDHYRRGHDDTGTALAAGIAGLALGAMLAGNGSSTYYSSGYYTPGYAYAPSYGYGTYYAPGYYAPGYYGYGYHHRPHVCAVWRHDRWGHAYRTTAWC